MVDYEKVGFKAGLEIHQQLDTGKLFCSCPGVLRDEKDSNVEVERKLHLVKGESGEFDLAAKYQSMEDVWHVYKGYDTTCLVELDEEPPHKINEDALRVAMEISLLLNCKIVPISQIMRKTVINGSNTSGFQRTVLIGRGGYIDTSEGRVGIDYVFLEEDSARKIKREENKIYWNLDRLGIPLVEIATSPDLKNAKHVKEAALKIGDILRSCRIRRGIGTIRQDVNISINGSNRVEIKGFQDPKIMEKVVDLEIERQLLYSKWKNIMPEFSGAKIVDVTDFLKTRISWIDKRIRSGDRLIGFGLKGFSGKIGRVEGGDNYWLGREVSGYAKTRGFGGVIHSDEDIGKYEFLVEEIEKMKKDGFGLEDGDGWMIFVGREDKVISMIGELIFPFLKTLRDGNPKEVRNCLADGLTEFIRPMPGAARMYPETDLELLKIGRDKVNLVKKNLPKLRSEIEGELKREGMKEEYIKMLLKRNKLEEFREISSVIDDLNLIARALLVIPKEIASKEGRDLEEIENLVDVESIIFVLEKVLDGSVEKGDLREIFERIVSGVELNRAVEIERVDLGEAERVIARIISEKPGLRANAYMGLVMKEFGGKINAREAMRIISKLI